MPCEPCNYTPSSNPDVIDPGVDPDPLDPNCACIINLLRVYLADYEGTSFSNTRLLQVLHAAQFYVASDLVCCDYVKQPSAGSCEFICHDPLQYPSYTQLVVLKAACIVNMGVVRSRAAADGIRATCGPASLAISSSSSFLDALYNGGPCKAYEELKTNLCFKCPMQSGALCAQIVGTFTSKNLRNCCTSNYSGISCQH